MEQQQIPKKCMGIQVNVAGIKELLNEDRDSLDCFVMLNCGRSSKTVMKEGDGEITVVNEIDDSIESFDSIDDMATSHDTIKKAFEKCAFYVYAYELDAEAQP
jgi:hypothetical protein